MGDSDASRTLLWSRADLGRVLFRPAKRLGNGGVKVDVEYDVTGEGPRKGPAAVALRQKLRVQTPRLRRVMIGESKYKAGKWTAAFSCNGHDTPGSEVNRFLAGWMAPFEAKVRSTSEAQSLAWFKKPLDLKTLEAMYTSCVKPASEASKEKHGSDLAPLLKCNIESSPSRIELDVYRGASRTPSSLAEFRDAQGSVREVVGILDLESVWFMGMQFGVTPVLRSLLYYPEDRAKDGFVEDVGAGGEAAFEEAGADPAAEEDRDVALRMLEDAPRPKKARRADDE
ncbi:hypothetical protein WJX74_007847 [Apatococcus lobatus]|uniref:Uncharacterized protein n=1 Tax=Apatococcus lobatus TaxID=904363 RepID=A0AAW1SFC1_9CHLO